MIKSSQKEGLYYLYYFTKTKGKKKTISIYHINPTTPNFPKKGFDSCKKSLFIFDRLVIGYYAILKKKLKYIKMEFVFSEERGCFIQSLWGGRTGDRKEDEQRILEALLIPKPPIKLISNPSSNPGFWLAEGGPMREENYLISNPRIKLMHHDSAALEHSLAWHTQRIYNSYFPIF